MLRKLAGEKSAADSTEGGGLRSPSVQRFTDPVVQTPFEVSGFKISRNYPLTNHGSTGSSTAQNCFQPIEGLKGRGECFAPPAKKTHPEKRTFS
jgi:hypothetical protein